MTVAENQPTDPDLAGLIVASEEIIETCRPDGPSRWLLIDVFRQRLFLVRDKVVLAEWPVSTASVGLDNREGSSGTPCGLHIIDRKIGSDAAPGTVFVSREPTGEVWPKALSDETEIRADDRDLILTRILTLAGLESGLNQGPGIDSRERYIYIHGTNHEELIGRPVSAGCVRMTNRDVSDLFERVAEGDPVVIL